MSRNQRRNRRNRSGANQAAKRNGNGGNAEDRSVDAARYRSSTETKSSLKTTELIAYAAAVLAVVITALAVDADAEGGGDPFGAESAIHYIALLTIGYMIARGLAKSRSYNRRSDSDSEIADDDAARTPVTHEDGAADEDASEDGDAHDSESDVHVAVLPSKEHAGAESTDAKA